MKIVDMLQHMPKRDGIETVRGQTKQLIHFQQSYPMVSKRNPAGRLIRLQTRHFPAFLLHITDKSAGPGANVQQFALPGPGCRPYKPVFVRQRLPPHQVIEPVDQPLAGITMRNIIVRLIITADGTGIRDILGKAQPAISTLPDRKSFVRYCLINGTKRRP